MTFEKNEEFQALPYGEQYYLPFNQLSGYSAEQDKLNGVNIGHISPVTCYYSQTTSIEINTFAATTITKTDGSQWGLLVGQRPKRKSGGL